MRKIKLLIILTALTMFDVNATFSLIAYDPQSGSYGAAFASCVFLPAVFDISDRVNAMTPNGTITTQAKVNILNNLNLQHGKEMIEENVRGNQIIHWLYLNDQDGITSSEARQYLILNDASSNGIEGFAYTGSEVSSDKGSITRDDVVIAGNTLRPFTLEAMYEGYTKDQDLFVNKLLASLTTVRDKNLGDSRCEGISSHTAFVKTNDQSWFYNSRNMDEDAIDGLEKIIHER